MFDHGGKGEYLGDEVFVVWMCARHCLGVVLFKICLGF